MINSTGPLANKLLAALPAGEWAHWGHLLEPVSMPLGQVLYESGARQTHAYFPTTAIVSLLYVTVDGQSAEIAVIGNDGVVGIALFMGGDSTPNRAVVQSAGWGYRLPAHAFKAECARSPALVPLLLRYTQALIAQMAQTAACNCHHSVAQQLCRWILLSIDRLHDNKLTMTQELIANMLGVRREGVTEAALKLQHAGVIRYSRGKIEVLDRAALEERSCECYAVVKAEYDRLLPAPTPQQHGDAAAHGHRLAQAPSSLQSLQPPQPHGAAHVRAHMHMHAHAHAQAHAQTNPAPQSLSDGPSRPSPVSIKFTR